MAHDETKQGHRNSIFDRGDSDRGSEETAALDGSDPSQLITSCGVGTMSCGRTSPARELKSQSCYHDRDSEPKEVESLASDVHNNRSSDRSEGDGKYSQAGNSKNEALPERHISMETEKSSPVLPNTLMAVSSPKTGGDPYLHILIGMTSHRRSLTWEALKRPDRLKVTDFGDIAGKYQLKGRIQRVEARRTSLCLIFLRPVNSIPWIFHPEERRKLGGIQVQRKPTSQRIHCTISTVHK